MSATTVYGKPKSFAWSYSKIKNYASCPKRHFHVDVAKDFKEDESEILTWGNEVHDKLAKRLAKKTPLPDSMKDYESWAKKLEGFPGQMLVEQKYGLTEDFRKAEFFGRDVWYRGIADVVIINDERALAVDWKLGKILEDSQQLALMAACLFGTYPAVQRVDTLFVWLKDDARTHEVFKREDMPTMWANMLPRVQQLRKAYEDNLFPPKPGYLCRRYCPVKTCPHHGE
jgi:hypothetical protein